MFWKRTIKILSYAEAEIAGFDHGCHSTPADAKVGEIGAVHQEFREKVSHDAAPAISKAQAKLDIYLTRKNESEQDWEKIKDTQPPEVMTPLLAVVVAIALVVGEGFFLAPLLDNQGIANPNIQYLVAGVIVLFGTALAEILIRNIKKFATHV